MNELIIKTPVSARELETRLHAFCDHFGAWDCQVSVEGHAIRLAHGDIDAIDSHLALMRARLMLAVSDGKDLAEYLEGQVYGTTEDGNLIVGVSVYGGANIVLTKTHLEIGDRKSPTFDQPTTDAIEQLMEAMSK